ncbi:MAG: acetamidase/formamidase family protein [Lachnospiraceae bacterium]
MYKIENSTVFTLSAAHEPVLRVPEGTELIFSTLDCFSNQLTNEEQSIDRLDWSRINPATGPVYIEEARPGDILKISILDIKVADVGTMVAIPENGVLGKYVTEGQIKRIPVKDGSARFNETIMLPCTPMIGVIGVAPKGDAVPCGEPGCHGGNMDNSRISVGSTLYLPVFHSGALLSMGDVHACMGDGEIMVSGLEISSDITVRVEIIRGFEISNPMLEDADNCYTIASDEDLETAVETAVYDMAKVLMVKQDLSFNEAGMLLSAAGNLEFCQVVDPKRTVRMAVPKTIITSLFEAK